MTLSYKHFKKCPNLKNGFITEGNEPDEPVLVASHLHRMHEVPSGDLDLLLVPLLESRVLHLKIHPLNTSTLPQDLDAAHVLLKVLQEVTTLRS